MKFLIDIEKHKQQKDAKLFLLLLKYRAMILLPEPECQLKRIDKSLELFYIKRQIAYKTISPSFSPADYKELDSLLKKRLEYFNTNYNEKQKILTIYAIKQKQIISNTSIPLYDYEYFKYLDYLKVYETANLESYTGIERIEKEIELFYIQDDYETRKFYIENMDENKKVSLTKEQSDKIVAEKSKKFSIIINLKKSLISLYCQDVFGKSNMTTDDIYRGLSLLETCQNIDTLKKADIIINLMAETEAKEQFRDFWDKRKDVMP